MSTLKQEEMVCLLVSLFWLVVGAPGMEQVLGYSGGVLGTGCPHPGLPWSPQDPAACFAGHCPREADGVRNRISGTAR